MKNRKAFTLIELVIVVVIIGILALMVLPQFGNVTHDAKVQTFNSNCQVATEAYAMYQAAHNGATPTTGAQMDDYINGGFAKLSDTANNISITYTNGVINGTFTCGKTGHSHTYKYPSGSNN